MSYREYLIALTSFSVGALVTAYVINDELKKKYENKVEKEIRSVIDSFHYTFKQTQENKKTEVDPLSKSFEEIDDRPFIPDVTEHIPYSVITVDDWDNDFTYEKFELSYFSEHGILVDEENNIIDDPNNIIDCDVLNHFGVYSNDPDIVYCRVHKENYDVKITRDPPGGYVGGDDD